MLDFIAQMVIVSAEEIAFPAWMVGIFATLILLLISMIGFFIVRLIGQVDKLSEAIQQSKLDLASKYVTKEDHSTDVRRVHERIDDLIKE